MKKRRRLAAAFLSLAMISAMSVTAYADELKGASGWYVDFTGENKLASNFRTADMDEAISGMQPGDAITFRVDVKNSNPASTEWYMSNEVLYSLEDRSRNGGTSGGAYEYELVYTDSKGRENVLFSSDTVGGENVSLAGEGLHEATDALEDYFYIDTLSKGQSGHVSLRVELDGETQGNDYQDTLADLQLNFAVTAAPDTPNRPRDPDEPDIPDEPVPGDPWIVKTGDDTDLGPMNVLMLACGAGFLALAVLGIHDRRKEKGGAR